MRRIAGFFSLIILPLWWIFTLVWQPSFVSTLAKISYQFEQPEVPLSQTHQVRTRALFIATRGTQSTEDLLLTTDEIAHLEDVYSLYVPISRSINFLSVCGWTILLAIILSKESLTALMQKSSTVFAALAAVGVIITFAFPFFFDAFHRIAFPQGNWAFPPDSLLIQAFPYPFWIGVWMTIVGSFALFALFYRFFSQYAARHDEKDSV